MGPQSIDIIRNAYDALAQGDMPSVLGAMAYDIEWNEAEGLPYGGVYRGADAVLQNVFGPITTDIADFAITPGEFIASGDTVAVIARYTGVGQATGKRLDVPVVHVWDTRDGKIARFRMFLDSAAFRAVLPAEVSAAG